MNKKEKRIFILFLIFSVFLFLCTVINFASGHIGAAIGGLGAGGFYLCLYFAAYEKSRNHGENKKDKESKQ